MVVDGLPMLDTLGSDPAGLISLQRRVRAFLSERLSLPADSECLEWVVPSEARRPDVRREGDNLYIGPFPVNSELEERMDEGDTSSASDGEPDYCFSAPTVSRNALRVARALLLRSKPVLLEGPPGVGKSATVQAMARATGRRLVRINLSEQSDVADLFGSDMPEGGAAVGR